MVITVLVRNGRSRSTIEVKSFVSNVVRMLKIDVLDVLQRNRNHFLENWFGIWIFWSWPEVPIFTSGGSGPHFMYPKRGLPKWPLFSKMTVIRYQNDRYFLQKWPLNDQNDCSINDQNYRYFLPKWPFYDQNDRYSWPKWPLPKWPLLTKMTVSHHQNDRYLKSTPKWPLFNASKNYRSFWLELKPKWPLFEKPVKMTVVRPINIIGHFD